MSRTATALVALLIVIAVVAYLLTDHTARRRAEPSLPVTALPQAVAPAPPVANPATTRLTPAPTARPAQLPVVATREDLAALLTRQGLPAERLIAAYGDWRRARGFLDSGPLTGPAQNDLGVDYYESLGPATLRDLAAAGDVAAMLLVGGEKYQQDQTGALEIFVQGSYEGSAQSMLAASETFRAIGIASIGNPDLAANPRLATLRRGKPDQDLRVDALAWSLAAIRQYGPAIVDENLMKGLARTQAQLSPVDVDAACEQSAAIFVEHRERQVRGGDLPPVFASPSNLYSRLPCGNTTVAVTPPPVLSLCDSLPASDHGGAPVDVWICPEP